jgi:hypothetical protein
MPMSRDIQASESRAARLAPRQHRLTWAPSAIIDTFALQEGAPPYTQCLAVGCPDDFCAVRVGLPNVTETPYRILRLAACASDTWNDYVNPTGPSEWTPLTFVHNGHDTDAIVSLENDKFEIDVAPRNPDLSAGETYVPRWTWSDWRPIQSVARTDEAGGVRVLMLRMALPHGQTITYASSGFLGYTGRPDIHLGFDYATGKWRGDCATIPGFIDPSFAAIGQGVNSMACIQFLTSRPGVTGIVTGDSHHAGTSATAQLLSFALRATLSAGAGAVGKVPLGYLTCATGGARSGNFFARLQNLLPAVRPGFVILPGWTYNDTVNDIAATEAACAIFFARLLMAADEVSATGAIPIFMTPFPRDRGSMTAAVLGPWRRIRDDILAMRLSGAIVVDATSVLGATQDGVFDGTYLPQFTNDQVHPNDAGHAAIAERLRPLLQAICGIQ